MLYVLLAFIAGVTVVVNRIINANLAERIGLLQGTFFNYLTGLGTAIICLAASGELIKGEATTWQLPWWAYVGGMIGVVVVMLSSYMNAKTSAFYLTLFIFIGQLFVGCIVDYMKVGTLSMGQVYGGLLVLGGLTYNLWIDKKEIEQ